MIEPKVFYHEQLAKFEQELEGIKKDLGVSSSLRLGVFIALSIAIYYSWGFPKVLVSILLVGVTVFVFLIIRHNRMQYERDLKIALIQRNKTELKVLDRDFYHLPQGQEFKDTEHWYGSDIDLFGRGSFYQYLNRTSLLGGSKLLADILLSNNIKDIEQKQSAIKELAKIPEWRQRFGATAILVKTELTADKVISWIKGYVPFLPKQIKNIARGFSVLSILVLAAYFAGWISGYWVFFVFLLGMAITGKFVKKVTHLSAWTSKVNSTFAQYSRLLALIEEHKFESELLLTKREDVVNSNESSSAILKQFSKLLDRLDQRNNILISLVLNGFFLRDLIITHQIETWILAHKNHISDWFNTIDFFDAYNSLGNYAFNHQDHIYPSIVDSDKTLESTGLSHPMLDPRKAVRNDIAIRKDEFFIITGANMAGKSTFLRTVSLQVVMANVGLPVCAQSVEYSPIKLITSMRTSDSLTDDESYFFSELKRLKFIIDEMGNDKYFIVLDEILKGTNSTDKAAGSQKFIEKLVKLGGTGIIATHDLSLCEVADDFDKVSNYYFDANIVNNELFFDYKFKKGVCQNMNASFLLKKMGVVE